MTEQKTIDFLKRKIQSEKNLKLNNNEHYKLAIKALEKQIPKKVVRPKGLLNEYYHEEECPHCKTEFKARVAGYRYTQAVGETHYCPNCGQRLSWE